MSEAKDDLIARLKPVAWRVKDYADGWIFYTDEKRARIEAVIMSGALVEPLYSADALSSLVRERDEARADNERDRSIIIDARNAIHDAIARRSWLLSGGRGSYEWDDDRWREEFGAAIDEIGKPLEILERLGVNWVNCPTDHASIVEARIDWKSRATTAEADAARMRALVEQAFRDGIVYGNNVSNADPDIAWQHSRARASLSNTSEGGKGE